MAEAARKRLGKGLSALLGEAVLEAPSPATAGDGVREVPVARCRPNPHQPRERFEPAAEASLAASVRDHGVLQPILVTPDGEGGYRIVAGERRWRAAGVAGLETIPAVVRRLEGREMTELALVENLQREDLNAIEEARGYRELAGSFGLTQAEIAQRVGKDRSTVANVLRLLELPTEVQELVRDGSLPMAHARALLGLEDHGERIRLAREAVARGYSTRQVEAQVRRARGAPSPRRAGTRSAHVRLLEEDLQRALATRVRIVERRRGTGTIEIGFQSPDEFERLHALLAGRVG